MNTHVRLPLPLKPRIAEAIELHCLMATADRVALSHDEAGALADAVVGALAEPDDNPARLWVVDKRDADIEEAAAAPWRAAAEELQAENHALERELAWWRDFALKVEPGSDLPRVGSPLLGARYKVERS